MFKALQPMLQERSINILLSANKTDKIGIYVSPVRKDEKEDNAFITPFRCEGSPEELNSELPGVLAQWLASRTAITTSLTEALVAAEAQTKAAADEAKKKLTEKNKKTTTVKSVPGKVATVATVTPSLLDSCTAGGGNDDGEDECTATNVGAATEVAAIASVAPIATESAPIASSVAPAPAPTVAAAESTVAPAAVATVIAADPITEELF